MSYEIGQNCEGLHDGRWVSCLSVSQEDEGYKVSVENWSSRYDAILAPQCLRPRSAAIECQSRKRHRLLLNFNKLFPEDEVLVDVDGEKKPATVIVVDPFLELLTVEIEKEEVIVPFDSVFPPDDEVAPPAPTKRRKQATPRFQSPPEAAQTPVPAQIPAPGICVVRPDGVEISCGDLVTISPACTDLAFLVTEIYQQDSGTASF